MSSSLEALPDFLYCFSAMSVCFFNSLPNGKYSNIWILETFLNRSFSSNASLQVTTLYLTIFTEDKAEILPVCLSKLYSG